MRYFVNSKTNGTHAVVRNDDQSVAYAACFTLEDAQHVARALEAYELLQGPSEAALARLCVSVERLTAQRRKTVETLLEGVRDIIAGLTILQRTATRPPKPEDPEAPYLWRTYQKTEL
jgi:hypothetical protein